MLIRCTKKLLDELKVIPESVEDEEPLFSWHANIILVNRRKTVVLMNDLSRYAVVLFGLKAKELKTLNDIAYQGIRETFQAEGIKDEVIDQYLLQAKQVQYTKTIDRTSVARLNKACESTTFFIEDLLQDSIIQQKVSKRVSRVLVGDGKNSYILPNEKLYEELTLFAGQSIFDTKAVILKVTLELENHQVWRRLVVPIGKTFDQLHDILQTAFDWQDYHLHDFTVYGEQGIGSKALKPIVNLVCHEESLDFPSNVDTKLEEGVKLSDYMPVSKKIDYHYDFGDDWLHEIVVEKVINNHDVNYSICLGGEGNRPPEDVGGKFGYEDYLRVIADPTDSEHEHTLNWGQSQRIRDFDLKTINMKLEYL